MKHIARSFQRALVAGVLAALPAVASAQTAPAMAPAKVHPPHVTIAHPISVSTCNPQRNNYVATGFVPAYYPVGVGPYWGWPTVYGPGMTYYNYPVQGNPTLGIDYHNATNVVMKKIEFGLVANGRLVAEVLDVGTFSPAAEIKHEFGLNPNVFPLQTGLPQCVPLKITFADGATWKNPHLPALRRQSMFGHPRQ
jgi:hypothetical protein